MSTNDSESSLFDGLKGEFRQTAAGLQQLATARWQLASIELKAARSSIERFGISLVIAAVLVLVALPVLIVAAVDAAGNPFGMPRWLLLAITGVVMIVLAGALAWLARRRFQCEFVGLEETMEEFHEDIVWLKEWIGEADAK